MPERLVDTCTICGRELTDDDHKVSEHDDGWAHDDCIALADANQNSVPHASSEIDIS